MKGEKATGPILRPRGGETYDEWFLRFASATNSRRRSYELRRELQSIHSMIIEAVMVEYGDTFDLETFLEG